MTKTGMAMTNRVLTRTRLSMNLPLRIPASTPAMTPMIVSKTIAMPASFAVVG